MSGSSGSSTTTVKRLPSYAEVYVESYLDRSLTLSEEEFVPYWDDGSLTHAVLTSNETAGVNALALRATSGNTTINGGADLIEKVLDGDFLDGSDSKFQTMIAHAHDELIAAVDEGKVLLGGNMYYIGDLIGENLAQDLSVDTGSDVSIKMQAIMYLMNYKNSRGVQDIVLPHGINYASQPYQDAEWLREAGLYLREWDQDEIEDQYKRWQEVETAQVIKLEMLGNAIRSMVGTQRKITEPYYTPSKAVGAVGGALTGAMIGSKISPGWGTAIGAVVGGVAGLVAQ